MMEKTFSFPIELVFKKCRETLRELDINISYESKSKWIIQASTGASLFSWGEEVEITFKAIAASKTKVSVKSEASAQLFSWGKDSENETKILNALQKKVSG